MDRALLEAFRRGERAALERIYYLYVRAVESRVRAVLVRMGRLAADDLADMVQDTFVQAFSDKARAQYDGARDYGPFLQTIARNVVIDWARRDREVPTADLLFYFSDTPDESATEADVTLFEGSLVATTEAYVDTLPADLRAVHHCRFTMALPQRQAAAEIGISRQSLRTLEDRLLRGFRQYLRRLGIEAVAPRQAGVHPLSKPHDSAGRTVVLARRG